MLDYPALLDLATYTLHPLGAADSFLVGRVESADVCLIDPACSRQHFRILRRNGLYHVEALNSANPTYHNGQPVTKTEPVEHGAVLQAGPARFQFLLRPPGGEAARTTAVTAAVAASPVAAAPSAFAPSSPSRRRRRALLLLVGCVGVPLVAVVIALGALLRQDNPKAEPASPDGRADSPPAAPAPPPDPRIEIVRPNVDRGVDFLKAKVADLTPEKVSSPDPAGRFSAPEFIPGLAGLIGLTLLECDTPANDPAVVRCAEIIRASAPGLSKTYCLSAALFFLNRLDESRPLDEQDGKLVRTFALRIIAGQNSYGIWSYGGVVMTADQEANFLAALKQGGYKPNGPFTGALSISNTQFALLALWGSRKHGVPVREPLLAAAAYFHANQFPDGHWLYPNCGLTASSTSAGLIALAVEKALLEDTEFVVTAQTPDNAKKKAAVDKALKYLAKTIGRKKEDPGGSVG